MADWLRPVFARTRSHNPQASDRASNFSLEDNNETEEALPPRLKPSSRVSSYISLARPISPPAQPPPPDPFSRIREPETIYHKPSADHMAESLKVVMMNQSTLLSVPVEYNSCILHVLEAYQEAREELLKKNEEMEELKKDHEKDIKEFEELATQWEFKERDYKAEMKKLEVQLSKTENGMEKVTLARTKSTVYGSKKIVEAVGRRVSTIKERNAARNSKGSDAMDEIPEFPDVHKDDQGGQQPFEPPSITRRQKRLRNPFVAPKLMEREIRLPSPGPMRRQQVSKSDLETMTSQVEPQDFSAPSISGMSSLTKLQLEELDRQQAEQDLGMAFESSTSTADSESVQDGSVKGGLRFGMDIDEPETSLLDIPKKPSPKKARHTTFDFPVTNYPQYVLGPEEPPDEPHLPTPPLQMGFSFQPGDDANLLSQQNSSDTTEKILATHLRHRSSTTSGPNFETSTLGLDTLGRSTRARSSPLEPQRKFRTPQKPFDVETNVIPDDNLKRGVSDSSVITAVRHNSGQSSSTVDGSSSQTRRRLGRGSGSSEAVTAAMRAFGGTSAGKNKGKNKILVKEKKSSSSLEENEPKGGKAGGKS